MNKAFTFFIVNFLLQSIFFSALFAEEAPCKARVNTLVNNNFEVIIHEYASHKNSKNKQAIIIIPPTGGKNFIDSNFAKYFCRNGIDSYILVNHTDDDEYNTDLEIHNRIMVRSQKALLMIFNSLKGYDIGLLATSAGGIIANIGMGVPDITQRISSYFSIVSGTPLCSIIAYAGEKTLKKVRKIRKEKYNFKSDEEYEKASCKAVTWKVPDKLPAHIKFGTITSNDDMTVLSKYQKRLVDNWKPKVNYELSTGHILTVIRSYYFYKSDILSFFKKTIKPINSKPSRRSYE